MIGATTMTEYRSGSLDTFRIYQPQWRNVHTIVRLDDNAYELASEMREYFKRHYLGTVRPSDVCMNLNTAGDNIFWADLMMRRSILLDEFATLAEAELFLTEHHLTDAEIVVRGSMRDQEITDYGHRPLR